MPEQEGSPEALAHAASASLQEHIQALLRAAEGRAEAVVAAGEQEARELREAGARDADEARQSAGQDAEAILAESVQAARQVLARIDAIADRLESLPDELRAMVQQDAGQLVDPRTEGDLESAPAILRDVAQIAENLRVVMQGPRPGTPEQSTRPRGPAKE